MVSCWLDTLPDDLLRHISSLLNFQLHADLMIELSMIDHVFNVTDTGDQYHTINFSKILNGTKYIQLQCSVDNQIVEIETTTVSYWQPEYPEDEPVIMITSNCHERFWLDGIWRSCNTSKDSTTLNT